MLLVAGMGFGDQVVGMALVVTKSHKRTESMRALDHDEHAPGPRSSRAVTLGIGGAVAAVVALLAIYAVVS